MYKNTIIIAEAKPMSPFDKRPPPHELMRRWVYLLRVASEIGDIVSIHTGERWGGSRWHVEMGHGVMSSAFPEIHAKPILAKGVHTTDEEYEAPLKIGAKYSLAVGFIPKNIENAIIEPWNMQQFVEFAAILPKDAKLLWNSRDLEALVKRNEKADKKEMFDDARKVWKHWLCQASNIRTVSDINGGADAILVGTHLEEFARSLSEANSLSL